MLEKLMAEIQAGGTLETGALAVRLGTSPQILAALLEHLRLCGYIQDYSTCGDGCQGCGLKAACGKGNNQAIHMWKSSES